MSRILVGTILAPDEQTKQWLALQLTALRATVDFEHVAIVPTENRFPNDTSAIEYFSEHTNIIQQTESGPFHSVCLSAIQDHFLERWKEFDGFLFLDSDAFPIRKGWFETLSKLMGRREIAAIYRPEFNETRLHASVVFVIPRARRKLEFVWAKRMARGGGVERDTYIDPYNDDWLRAHRLVRTNRINVHPMLAGVYGDMFYHHGHGSRNYRHSQNNWYQSLVDDSYFGLTVPTRLKEELVSNPREFLGQFMWDSSLCAMPDSLGELGMGL